LDTAKKFSTEMDQHFEENSTNLKAAMYHLNKNEPREVAHILEKVLRLNKSKQQQIAYQFQTLTMKSAAMQQKVNALQSREKFLLQSTAKMQQKFEHFDLAFFDEDMELPEPKNAKRIFLSVRTKQTEIYIFDT
jgi:hypothetical protein